MLYCVTSLPVFFLVLRCRYSTPKTRKCRNPHSRARKSIKTIIYDRGAVHCTGGTKTACGKVAEEKGRQLCYLHGRHHCAGVEGYPWGGAGRLPCGQKNALAYFSLPCWGLGTFSVLMKVDLRKACNTISRF